MAESDFDDEYSIDLSRATRSVWRERWFLGVLFLLAVGVGVATTFFTHETGYVSQTTLFVEPIDDGSVAPTSLEVYESIMRSDWVKRRVARRIRTLSVLALDSALTVESTRDPNLIRIKVRGDSPEEAVNLLTVWSDVFIQRLRTFQGQRVNTASEMLRREIQRALRAIADVQGAFEQLDAVIQGSENETVGTTVSDANSAIENLNQRLRRLHDVLRQQRTTVYPIGGQIFEQLDATPIRVE